MTYRGSSARLRRFLPKFVAVTASLMILTGCTFDLPFLDKSEKNALGAPESSSVKVAVAAEPSFKNGAVEAWALTDQELLPPRPEDNGEVMIHPDMVLPSDPLVFGNSAQTRALDPLTQTVVWEHEGLGPAGKCDLDENAETVFCPARWSDTDSAYQLTKVDIATGKMTEIDLKGLDGTALSGRGEIRVVPEGLILYEIETVLKVDRNGKVLWQQPVQTKDSDNRYVLIGDSQVFIQEPPAGVTTIVDLNTGEVIYSGDSTGAPSAEKPEYRAFEPNPKHHDWDTGDHFNGDDRCVFAAEDVVFYAPDNCRLDSTQGTVFAYDIDTGELLWEMDINGQILAVSAGQYLITRSGTEQVVRRISYTFDSVTIYRPALPGEQATSRPAGDRAAIPAGIPSCPDSTILLSWAEISNGWVLVCGISESEPTVWVSQFGTGTELTSSNVTYTATPGSGYYEVTFPSGSQVRLDYSSTSLEILRNTGDILDAAGNQANSLPVLIIYFVHLGTKNITDAGATNVAGSDSSGEASPFSTRNAPTQAAPSSRFCPAGSSPHFEGETDGFFISICKNNAGGFTYVGYSPELGEMLLPTQNLGTHWRAENESHAYVVTPTNLEVYELAGNNSILNDPFAWTRKY